MQSPALNRLLCLSYTQCHDRIDYVISVLFQCLDSLLPRNIGLGHNKFDVLAFQPCIIDFLLIIIILFRLLDFLFAPSMIVVMAGMIMAGMVSGTGVLCCGKLLGCVCLGLRVQIFDFGFAKDARL